MIAPAVAAVILGLLGLYGLVTKRDHWIEYVWCLAAVILAIFTVIAVVQGRGS